MFELKLLSAEAVPAALEKAKHYRLLNEPGAAQSICLDILQTEPENQDALITIVLAMSDRFGKDYAIGDSQIKDYLARFSDEYERAYYTGIVYERRAKASLIKKCPARSRRHMSFLCRQWIGSGEPKRFALPETMM